IGSTMKAVQAGIAAKNAVLAVCLAQAGTHGSSQPFVGQGGWLSLMSADSSDISTATAINDWGSGHSLDEAELIQKYFPCCASAHKTLDAIAEIWALGDIEVESI